MSISIYKGMTVGALSDCVLADDYYALRTERDHLKDRNAQVAAAYEELRQAMFDLEGQAGFRMAHLKDQNAALLIDANRYRWLRIQGIVLDGHDFISYGHIADFRIDAAMSSPVNS